MSALIRICKKGDILIIDYNIITAENNLDYMHDVISRLGQKRLHVNIVMN